MSIRQHIRIGRRNGALYFEARDTGDRQIAEFLRFIDAYVQLSSPGGFVPAIKTSAPTHENVVQFLNRIAQIANGPSATRLDGTVEAKRFVAHCDEHSRYLQSKCVEFGINPVNTWSGGLRISALDPEAIIPGFCYGDDAYRFLNRTALAERANELMAACYERMLTLRHTENIAGNSAQDAILPFMMEYSHRRFPYIIGNLNGLYWYALSSDQYLEHMTTLSGFVPGDIVFDCGSHTGYVAHAMTCVGARTPK